MRVVSRLPDLDHRRRACTDRLAGDADFSAVILMFGFSRHLVCPVPTVSERLIGAIELRAGSVPIDGEIAARSSSSPPFILVAVLLLPPDPSRSYRGGAGIADE